MRMVVVLPAPEGPTIPRIVPDGTARSRSNTPTPSPKSRVAPRSTTRPSVFALTFDEAAAPGGPATVASTPWVAGSGIAPTSGVTGSGAGGPGGTFDGTSGGVTSAGSAGSDES